MLYYMDIQKYHTNLLWRLNCSQVHYTRELYQKGKLVVGVKGEINGTGVKKSDYFQVVLCLDHHQGLSPAYWIHEILPPIG